jgi:hypothetical protein
MSKFRHYPTVGSAVIVWRGFEEEEAEPRMAIWRNKDHDQPVTITGELGKKEGKRFCAAKETTTGIPEDELEFNE